VATAEIAVVGAGVNGLAAAHALTAAGRDVVVYEQFELGHARGSSHGRTRIFRLAYPETRWVRLAVEALAGWRALEEEADEQLLVLSGLLELVRDQAQSSQAALEECGVACELLLADEAKRRFGVTAAEGSLVLFQPEAGTVYAERALRAFARGLRIEEGRRVESLDVPEPVVVVTAGPWARRLLAGAGIDLPVVETRETVAYFRLEGEVPSVVAEIVTRGHGFYSLADPLYGLKVGSHMRGRPADPDEERPSSDEATVREIAEWTAARFPLADPEPVRAETCFYTTTDDERFILERHGRIVVGSACSGHGFKFAPAVGARIAALAVEALA
jgi:sarcosine oxidase